jgi:hypothetical protein
VEEAGGQLERVARDHSVSYPGVDPEMWPAAAVVDINAIL